MKRFLVNLAFLAGIFIIIFIAFPTMMKQVFELYNGLGILGLFVVMLILAAIPRRSRRRH